jgi:hypothetical protein
VENDEEQKLPVLKREEEAGDTERRKVVRTESLIVRRIPIC